MTISNFLFLIGWGIGRAAGSHWLGPVLPSLWSLISHIMCSAQEIQQLWGSLSCKAKLKWLCLMARWRRFSMHPFVKGLLACYFREIHSQPFLPSSYCSFCYLCTCGIKWKKWPGTPEKECDFFSCRSVPWGSPEQLHSSWPRTSLEWQQTGRQGEVGICFSCLTQQHYWGGRLH